MMEYTLIILIGLIGGISVGLQSPISAAMGQRVGGTASSFIVHMSGMLLSGVLLFLRGGEKIRDWASLPWYMLGAGVFGVILYQSMTITFPRLGSTTMISLIIIGQLVMGIIIDHFGWFNVTVHSITPTRLAGVVVLMIGTYLIAK
jgi:bacterial/archaeal transporter family-2 protein